MEREIEGKKKGKEEGEDALWAICGAK